MITLTSSLPHWNLAQKRVFLRVDFNVPLQADTVLNDFRLRAALPTISLLQKKGAHIILGTHMGRPSGYDDRLSTKWLIPWLKSHSINPIFIEDPTQAGNLAMTESCVLLDNLRFFAGEKNGDRVFAQMLANQADYYVQDAFATIHRNDASIALTPEYFAPDKRTIGLLIEHELAALNKLLDKPKAPFVLILGGGKVTDKIPLIKSLMPLISSIILGPAIANTFLYSEGISVGASLVDLKALALVKEIIAQVQEKNIQLILPEDVIVAQNSLKGALRTVSVNHIERQDMTISMGPATLVCVQEIIAQAGTVFYNGLMGSLYRPETLHSAFDIFNAMAKSSAFTVIAGGDSVAAAQINNSASKISYLSTGGGATLTYLSGQTLPGLQPFLPSKAKNN